MGRRRAAGSASLGRALIRHQTQRTRSHRHSDSWLHTSELNDGYEWGRLNLQSVTEQSSLDDFLATAELAGTEFVAEKLNIKFVLPEARTGLLSFEESQRIKKLHEENRQFLCIPRRPNWDKNTSPEELKQAEKDNFLKWRRQLVRLEEEQKLMLTPFERNLDFWRQLWRVIERSDIVVQIVDARNPLLFRCEDLECYVKEIDANKENVILINKADLLTEEQRSAWATYFEKENVKIIFWSALAESIELNAPSKEQAHRDAEEASAAESESSSLDGNEISHSETHHLPGCGSPSPSDEDDSEYEDCLEEGEDEEDWQTCSEEDSNPDEEPCAENSTVDSEAQGNKTPPRRQIHNFSHLVSKQELLELFKQLHTGKKVKDGQLTVGLHLLVYVCQNIPRRVLEATYGISIIKPREDEDPHRPPTSEELLTAYGCMRGFMTAHGQPDQPRSARYILKDYVKGKLLYCHPPPGRDPVTFQHQHQRLLESRMNDDEIKMQPRGNKKAKQIENAVDKTFFHQENVRALTKGVQAVMGYKPGSGLVTPATVSAENGAGKPWKKHGNKNKKEKSRRLYKHLDM
ncbi:PREDICTED: large subunit GTPase 1 homolog [Dipodomys ordii]|uniref:Large subunit GTPase 1 homolog n=1 Tax=Dipodomys ordii TaxID=10020 RepID=A0A1S3FFD2_DIPOR|nr:PREDICTED: large subunit GTPase 1 homolog [Dipodomys ordii]